MLMMRCGKVATNSFDSTCIARQDREVDVLADECDLLLLRLAFVLLETER